MSDQLTAVMQALSQVQGNTAHALSSTMQAKNDRRRLELQEKQQKTDNIFRGIETGVNTVGMGMNLWGDYKNRQEAVRSNQAQEAIAEEQNDLTRRGQDLQDSQFYAGIESEERLQRYIVSERGKQALDQINRQGEIDWAELRETLDSNEYLALEEIASRRALQDDAQAHESEMLDKQNSFRLEEIDAMKDAEIDKAASILGMEADELRALAEQYPDMNVSIGSGSASHPADYGGVGTSLKDGQDMQFQALEQYKQDINLHEVVNEMGEVDPVLVRDYITDLYRQTGDTPPANLDGMSDQQLLSEMWTMINESPRATQRRTELWDSFLSDVTPREKWEGLATGLNAFSLREGVEPPEEEGMTSDYLSFLSSVGDGDGQEWVRDMGETAFSLYGRDEVQARELVTSVDRAVDTADSFADRQREEGPRAEPTREDKRTFEANYQQVKKADRLGLVDPGFMSEWRYLESALADKFPGWYERKILGENRYEPGVDEDPNRTQAETAEENPGAAQTWIPSFNIPY